jgi:acetyl esterase
MRRYRATVPPTGDWIAVFAHGGYFVLGDLDLQDPYCRRLAIAIGGEVLSVDYALAPEHSAAASIADVVHGVAAARELAPAARIALCGDSAGGAIAFLAAARLRDAGTPPDAVVLTNPNADLTLSLFDHDAPAGPDPDLSRRAIAAWAGGDPVAASLSPLHITMTSMPRTFVAVGDRDAFLPEDAALVDALSGAHVEVRLLTLHGVGHGFVGGNTAADEDARDRTLHEVAAFLTSRSSPAGR